MYPAPIPSHSHQARQLTHPNPLPQLNCIPFLFYPWSPLCPPDVLAIDSLFHLLSLGVVQRVVWARACP